MRLPGWTRPPRPFRTSGLSQGRRSLETHDPLQVGNVSRQIRVLVSFVRQEVLHQIRQPVRDCVQLCMQRLFSTLLRVLQHRDEQEVRIVVGVLMRSCQVSKSPTNG